MSIKDLTRKSVKTLLVAGLAACLVSGCDFSARTSSEPKPEVRTGISQTTLLTAQDYYDMVPKGQNTVSRVYYDASLLEKPKIRYN